MHPRSARHALGKKPSPTAEEKEFIVTMQNTWEKAREQGRDEGRTETLARGVVTVLRVRGIAARDPTWEQLDFDAA